MDADTFDDLVKRLTERPVDRLAEPLSVPGSRRALLRLVTALPITGALVRLLNEEGEAAGRRKRRKTRNKRQSGDKKRNRKGKQNGDEKGKGKKDRPVPGCTPTTCAAQGKNCGSIPDGCGGTVSCGSCSGTRPICSSGNVCVKCSGPNSCPNGCCAADGSCPAGTGTSACGPSGDVCVDCGTGGLCQNGQCSCGTCSGTTPFCSSTNVCVNCATRCGGVGCGCVTTIDGATGCWNTATFNSCPALLCTANANCSGTDVCVERLTGSDGTSDPPCVPVPPPGEGFCVTLDGGSCPA